MGYAKWIVMHTAEGVAVGECKSGEREYVQVAAFDGVHEAHAFIGRARTDAHTARTLDWRRRTREAEGKGTSARRSPRRTRHP